MVRFTCGECFSKPPTDALLHDRSSCQFGELFWNHKQTLTAVVWIARHVPPVNTCKIAKSSELQVTMPSKSTYMWLHVSLAPLLSKDNDQDHQKQSSELRWLKHLWI